MDGGMINTWYGLCDKFLIQMGHKLDYNKAFKEQGYWKEIQDLVIEENIPEDWLFDSLIVDEGQDFEQEWFEILKLFLRSENSDIVWFEDQGQNLTRKKPVELDGFVTYHSKVNYRTPQSIAKYIDKQLNINFECGNDLPGLGVEEHHLENIKDKEKFLDQVVSKLVKKGFSQDQIAILSFRGIGKSDYLTIKQFGNFKLKKFTGEYDKNGNQLYTDGDITFESIYRFKGQQSPAIILVDIDPNPRDKNWYNKLLYCGMTRATVRLDIIF
jgi:superfamily I DNA and RNA helicase